MSDEVKRNDSMAPPPPLAGVQSRTEQDEQREQEIDQAADIARTLLEQGVPRPDIDPRPFAQLLKSEADLQRVFECVEQAIWRSFGEDIRRSPFDYTKPTLPEIKRRFRICENWFRRARGDVGYSLEQTLDYMGRALRCELDGSIFDPPKPGSRIYTAT